MLLDDLIKSAPSKLKSMPRSSLILLVSPSAFLRICEQENVYPKTRQLRVEVAKKTNFLGIIYGIKIHGGGDFYY